MESRLRLQSHRQSFLISNRPAPSDPSVVMMIGVYGSSARRISSGSRRSEYSVRQLVRFLRYGMQSFELSVGSLPVPDLAPR